MKNILMVSIHPDDVEISCLGTLFKHQENGDKIIYVSVTECDDLKRNKNLHNEVMFAMNIIRPDEMYRLKLPNRKLNHPDNMEKLRWYLEKIRDSEEISRVYGPWLNDIHQDHSGVAEEVIRVFRYNTIFQYENTHSCQNFIPNHYIRIPFELYKKKIKVLSYFLSQDASKLCDMATRLMEYRGIEVQSSYAEAFQVWRMIE